MSSRRRKFRENFTHSAHEKSEDKMARTLTFEIYEGRKEFSYHFSQLIPVFSNGDAKTRWRGH